MRTCTRWLLFLVCDAQPSLCLRACEYQKRDRMNKDPATDSSHSDELSEIVGEPVDADTLEAEVVRLRQLVVFSLLLAFPSQPIFPLAAQPLLPLSCTASLRPHPPHQHVLISINLSNFRSTHPFTLTSDLSERAREIRREARKEKEKATVEQGRRRRDFGW